MLNVFSVLEHPVDFTLYKINYYYNVFSTKMCRRKIEAVQVVRMSGDMYIKFIQHRWAPVLLAESLYTLHESDLYSAYEY